MSLSVIRIPAEKQSQRMYDYVFDASGRRISFLDWLWERYHTTPLILLDICKNTARYGSGRSEFEKLMVWCRRRYRFEMDLREQLIKNNPFEGQLQEDLT